MQIYCKKWYEYLFAVYFLFCGFHDCFLKTGYMREVWMFPAG